MAKLCRIWLLVAFSFALAACGGGGSIEKSGSIGDSSGDNYALSISLENSSGESASTTSKDSPLTATATLTKNGSPLVGEIVSFAADIGTLSVESGRVQTDSEGKATIVINAGTTASAGQLTATITVDENALVDTANFTSAGDGEDVVVEPEFQLTISLVDKDGNSAVETSNDSNLTAIASLSSLSGESVSNLVVTFSSNVGVLGVANGTVLTNDQGVATILVEPGTTEAAGVITASVEFDSGTVSASANLTSKGDGEDQAASNIVLSSKMYLCAEGFVATTSALVEENCSESNQIDTALPLYLVVTVIDSEKAAGEQQVVDALVSAQTATATLSPTNGQAVSDAQGKALFSLSGAGSTGGDQVTISLGQETILASYQVNTSDVAGNEALQIGLALYNCPETWKVSDNNLDGCVLSTSNVYTNGEKFVARVLVSKTSNSTPPDAPQVVTAQTTTLNLNASSQLTDLSTGLALFELFPQGVEGADTLTVTVGEVSTSINYAVPQLLQASSYKVELFLKAAGASASSAPNIDEVSFANQGELLAIITKDNEALPSNESYVVTFNASLGTVSPSSGTTISRTGPNNEGVTESNASVVLRAGAVKGGGQATASIVVNGETIESEQVAFITEGDDIGLVSENYRIKLDLVDSVGDAINEVSKDQVGELRATVTAIDGEAAPVENAVVTFESTAGLIVPTSGTALTDGDGVAIVNIRAGSAKAAGQVRASYADTEDFVFFETLGDEIDTQPEYFLEVDVVDCGELDTDTQAAECSADNDVTLTEPKKIRIRALNGEGGAAVESVLVQVQSDIGALSPITGRVLTDNNGYAFVDLFASDDQGAGQIDVSVPASATQTVTSFFEIGSANIAMGSFDDTATFVESALSDDINGSLAPGRTASISITIVDQDNSNAIYSEPVIVNFSSSCASQETPLAFIDATATTVNGVATATYRADGCVAQDQITATATAGTRSLTATGTVQLQVAKANSIEFVSVQINDEIVTENPIISFPGTGDSDKASITFRVTDENNNAKSGEAIAFGLATSVGDLTFNPACATSDSNGQVIVNVQSGRVATDIRVKAHLLDSEQSLTCDSSYDVRNDDQVVAYALSRYLSVTTGVADQDSFDLVVETLNLEAWEIAGVENVFTLYSSDMTNHPVSTGTTATFQPESGQMTGSCVLDGGSCTSTWRATDPRPDGGYSLSNGFCDVGNDNDPSNDVAITPATPCFGPTTDTNGDGTFDATDNSNGALQLARPRNGRVTVLVIATGEETYVDSNSNGLYDYIELGGDPSAYDAGTDVLETFYDLDEAFHDHNNDGRFCGQLNGLSQMPAPADPDTAFDVDVTWANGIDTSNCLFVASYGAQSGNNYLPLGSADETPVDFDSDGSYDYGNDLYNGMTCSDDLEALGACTKDLLHVRDDVEFVMSGSTPYLLVVDSSGNTLTNGNGTFGVVDLTGGNTANVVVYITDINNNPMPNETTVAFEVTNGELNAEFGGTFLNTNTTIPAGYGVTISPEKLGEGNDLDTGELIVTVTTPGGTITRSSILTILDDR